MKTEIDFDVALVGAGCAGTLFLLHLAASAKVPLRVAVVDPNRCRARGIAYRTENPLHLLNVPASRMGAYASEPEDFLDWLRLRDPSATPYTFAPRKVYGDYLEERLSTTLQSKMLCISDFEASATDLSLDAGKIILHLSNQKVVTAHHAVLALGTPEPHWPSSIRLEAVEIPSFFISDPWAVAKHPRLKNWKSVHILGTGLTSIDAVCSLRSAGFQGRISMISRHGLLSLPHDVSAYSKKLPEAPSVPLSPRGVLRWLRITSRDHDWRLAVDSLRKITPEIWQHFSDQQRSQFLRHCRVYWDIHRHRMAPQIRELLQQELLAGTLEVHAGTVLSAHLDGQSLRLEVRIRGSKPQRLQSDALINCSGFGDLRLPNGLLATLETKRLLRSDRFGLGYSPEPSATADVSRQLFLLGAVRRGELWESIAVPELRAQAKNLAERVTSEAPERRSQNLAAPEYGRAP